MVCLKLSSSSSSVLHIAHTHTHRSLADTQDRGALDCTDFVIGLYLIQASMSGQLSFIPNFLPPGLYEQAGGGGPPPSQQQPTILTHTTGTSGSISPTIPQQTRTSVLHSQYTGQQQNQQQPPLSATASRFQSRPGASPAAFPASPFASPPRSILLSQVPPWDVTAAEKASSDRYFDTLDHQRKGYIDGDAAVPFMLESKLSGDELAHIWYVVVVIFYFYVDNCSHLRPQGSFRPQ